MYQLNIDRNTYERLKDLLPDFKSDIIIDLISCDINLEKLGFCKSAPCVVNIDIDKTELERIMDEIMNIEIDYAQSEDYYDYKKYKKYCWIWDQLNSAKDIS